MKQINFLLQSTLLFVSVMLALSFSGCASMRGSSSTNAPPPVTGPLLLQESAETPVAEASNVPVITYTKENAEKNAALLAEADRRAKDAEEKLATANAKVQTLNEDIKKLENELLAKAEEPPKNISAYPSGEPEKIANEETPPPSEKKIPVIPAEYKTEVLADGELIKIRIPESEVFLDGTKSFLPVCDNLLKAIANAINTDFKENKLGVEVHVDSKNEGTSNKDLAIALTSEKARLFTEYLYTIIPEMNGRFTTITGKGFENPIADMNTEENCAKNRRIEIIIYPK